MPLRVSGIRYFKIRYNHEDAWTVTALGYGTLVSVEKTNKDLVEFVLKLDPPIEMIPGQFVTVRRVEE